MKIRKLMPLSDYWREQFPKGKPTLRALQKQCANGLIPAIKRGNWYVKVEEAESITGDDLFDMVLNNDAA